MLQQEHVDTGELLYTDSCESFSGDANSSGWLRSAARRSILLIVPDELLFDGLADLAPTSRVIGRRQPAPA